MNEINDLSGEFTVCVLVTAAFALALVPGFRQPARSLLSRRDQGTALLVFMSLGLLEEATAFHSGLDERPHALFLAAGRKSLVSCQLGAIRRAALIICARRACLSCSFRSAIRLVAIDRKYSVAIINLQFESSDAIYYNYKRFYA
jgi:hypothetical protein